MKALGFNYKIEGYGHVIGQSIPPLEDVNGREVIITLDAG